MAKIDTLNSVIEQCDKLINMVERDYPDVEEGSIEKFVYRMVNTYYANIPNLTYCVTGRDFNEQEDMLDSLTSLKTMLINYKDELEDTHKQSTRRDNNMTNININQIQKNQQSQIVKVSSTFEQTIIAIHDIPTNVLSENDKDILIEKLNSLEIVANKDKNNKYKVWEKVKGILTWVADKGADAGIALLPITPYIVQIMQNLK